MRRIRNAFVTGLLVLVPLMATFDILRWFFQATERVTRTYLPHLPFDFWGMGILFAILIILATGILTQNYVGTLVVGRFDRLISKFPLVGGIYGAIKKFLETIFSPSSNQFKDTVLIEFPNSGQWSVGFVTGEPDPKLQSQLKEPMVNVFIPLVPNPISGFYVLVPKSKVKPLDMSVQNAFKLVVSMGIVKSDEELPELLASSKRKKKPAKKKKKSK